MAFGLSNNAEQKSKDQQAKTIKDSITKSESLLTGVLNSVQKKCRKEAALRDCSDIMCKSLQTYSVEETPQTRNGLGFLADSISQIQDYRQAMIDRMEARVIVPLQTYEHTIKQVRSNINLMQKSKVSQNNSHVNLNNLANNPNNLQTQTGQQNLAHAASELQRNIIMNQNNGYQMQDTAVAFEHQKKTDVKRILLDYVNSEMQFYANAIECLAKCKPILENIDPEQDMVWFKQMLQLPTFNGGLVGGLPIAQGTNMPMNGQGQFGVVPGGMAPMGMPGQQMPGQQMPGQQMPGQQMPGQPMPGQQIPGQQLPNQPMGSMLSLNNQQNLMMSGQMMYTQPMMNLQQPITLTNNNPSMTQMNGYTQENTQNTTVTRNVTFNEDEDDLEEEYRKRVESMDRGKREAQPVW